MAISTSSATSSLPFSAPTQTVCMQKNFRTTGPLRAEDVGPLFLALQDAAGHWNTVASYLLSIADKNAIKHESMGDPNLALIKTLDTWIQKSNEHTLESLIKELDECSELGSIMCAFKKKIDSGNVFVTFTPASTYESEALKEVCLKFQLHNSKEKWYRIGLGLGLTVDDLETIKQEHVHRKVSEWMSQALNVWTSKDGSTASWQQLEYVLNKLSIGSYITQDLKIKYEEALKKQTSDWDSSLSYQLSQHASIKPYSPHDKATSLLQTTHPQHATTTSSLKSTSGLQVPTPEKTSPVNKLTMKQLRQLEEYLPTEAWKEIGQHLGFKDNELRNIQATYFSDDTERMFNMLEQWLFQKPNANLTALGLAVKNAGTAYPDRIAEFNQYKRDIFNASKKLLSSGT